MRYNLQYYEEILEGLRELSDLEWQERVWIRQEGPEVSWPNEHAYALYEDTLLSDRLETAGETPVFSPEADATLKKLQRVLYAIAPSATPESIMNAQQWSSIRTIAAKALQQIKVVGPPTEFDDRPEDRVPPKRFYDAFVLCKNRTRALAEEFLNHFLPLRTPISDKYPYPRRVEKPVEVFNRLDELLDRLEAETETEYTIHWVDQGEGASVTASLFFTNDSRMIAGLATCSHNRGEFLKGLAKTVGGSFGFVIREGPPPNNSQEFIEFCKNSKSARLVDGRLLT